MKTTTGIRAGLTEAMVVLSLSLGIALACDSNPGSRDLFPFAEVGFHAPVGAEDVREILEGRDGRDPPRRASPSGVAPLDRIALLLDDSIPGFGKVHLLRDTLAVEIFNTSFGPFLRYAFGGEDRFLVFEGVGGLIPVGTVFQVESCKLGTKEVAPGFLTFTDQGLRWSPKEESG